MRSSPLLALVVLVSLAGCAGARIDPALEARAPASRPGFAADGSFRFLEYVVDRIQPPAIEERRHPHASDEVIRELLVRFVLHEGSVEIPVSCEIEGRDGSVAVDAQASLVCEADRLHLVISGSGSSDVLRLGRVDGVVVHRDHERDPPAGSPALVRMPRLAVEGSAAIWNLRTSYTTFRHGEDGQWRSDCCEREGVVAAAQVDPPRIHFDPGLAGVLRTEAALAVAALFVVHEHPAVEPAPR